MSAEPFCAPKELGGKLAAFGVPCMGQDACQSLIRAMKAEGTAEIVRGHHVRPSDAFAFLRDNPEWKPFRKTKNKETCTH